MNRCNFFGNIHPIAFQRFIGAGLYPRLGAPIFNQFGGNLPAGFNLLITHTNASGITYFTVDGSDPRLRGGAISPSAQAFAAPLQLNSPTLVRARVKSGSIWSALVEAMFYPPQDLSKLEVTEIMYAPPGSGLISGDEFEFLELKNGGPTA